MKRSVINRMVQSVKYLHPKRWTIAWWIALGPVASALITLPVLIVGLKVSEQQLDQIESQVEQSLAQHEAMLELPRIFASVRAKLYRLAAMERVGIAPEEITRLTFDLQFSLEEMKYQPTSIDSVLDGIGLPALAETIARSIDQIIVLFKADPSMAILGVRGTDRLLREAEFLAQAMSAHAFKTILDDLRGIRETTTQAAWTFFAVVFALGLLMSLAALLLSQRISRPILALAHTVRSLKRGQLDVVVPAKDRADEIGRVAAAIEAFKDSLHDNKVLQKERDELNRTLEQKVIERTQELAVKTRQLDETQKRANEQRQKMTAQLRREFGQVIKAASAGDFTKFVETNFDDENLQALSEDINTFVKRVDGSVAAVGRAMNALVDGDAKIDQSHGFTGAFADIMSQIDQTARQIQDQSSQLTHLALHDALTGLPNRRFLEERLDAYAKLSDMPGLGVAVLHIDLDRFKEINDTMGHAAGDQILKRTADVLNALSGNDDFVARVGGDEFILLCPTDCVNENESEKARIKAIGDQIVEKLSHPIMIAGQETRFGASVGISFSKPGATDLSNLIIDADIALYQAKNSGRNQAQIFSDEAGSAFSQNKLLRDELLRAIEQDEFVPYFQPKYDAATYQMTGVEALVRWQHPDRGLLTPNHFLGTAEDMNLVRAIDDRILWRSVEAMKRMNSRGIHIPELSVNLSQQRLYDPDLISSLDNLDGPFTVSFELLESIFFDEQDDRFYWCLDALRERNIGIQIDDFGSGRASISALISIQPDKLKIDRSLVSQLGNEKGNSLLIKGIVDIARSMHVGVIAEGVETMQQAELLRDLGCDILQGYAFARPMSEEDLVSTALKQAV